MAYGKSEILREGEKTAILAVGSMVSVCGQVTDMLVQQGKNPTLVNARFVKPLDTELLDRLAEDHRWIVTVEENVKNGGFGEHVTAYMEACHPQVRVLPIAIWDRFVEQGRVEDLQAKVGLNSAEILQAIENCED